MPKFGFGESGFGESDFGESDFEESGFGESGFGCGSGIVKNIHIHAVSVAMVRET